MSQPLRGDAKRSQRCRHIFDEKSKIFECGEDEKTAAQTEDKKSSPPLGILLPSDQPHTGVIDQRVGDDQNQPPVGNPSIENITGDQQPEIFRAARPRTPGVAGSHVLENQAANENNNEKDEIRQALKNHGGKDLVLFRGSESAGRADLIFHPFPEVLGIALLVFV